MLKPSKSNTVSSAFRIRNHKVTEQLKIYLDNNKSSTMSLLQLCPTQTAYWAKSYVTISTRATQWMAYFDLSKPNLAYLKLMYWKRSNPNCSGNRRDKEALKTTCVKNVKLKIVKIRPGCQHIL